MVIVINIYAFGSSTQCNLLIATGQLDHLQLHVEGARANLIAQMVHLFLVFYVFIMLENDH